MSEFGRAIWFELQKLRLARSTMVMLGLLIVAQPLLCYIEGLQFLKTGLDAVPTPENGLAEPLPALPFMGFDAFPFGHMVVGIVAALWGAATFRDGELRTTFLAVNDRAVAVAAKLIAVVGFTAVVALVSSYASVGAIHLALGPEGLSPLALPSATWLQIGREVGFFAAIAASSYALALATRTWIVALVFFVPQILGFTEGLAPRWTSGTFLPVDAGHCLLATPEVPCTVPVPSVMAALTIWTVALVAIGATLLYRRDVGAT